MYFIRLYIIFLVMLMTQFISYGQEMNVRFVSVEMDSISNKLLPADGFSVNSITGAQFQAKEIVYKLQTEGYLTAGVDSFISNNDSLIVKVFIGKKYAFGIVKIKDKDKILVSNAGYKPHLFNEQSFNHELLSNLLININTFGMQNGYPFISVSFDSISFNNDTISGTIDIDRGSFYTWDTIDIQGDVNIKNEVVQSFLGITYGKPFDFRTIEKIDENLKNMLFLVKNGNTNIVFTNDGKAKLTLILKKTRTGSFNGIAGILPDQQNNNKLMLTGELSLFLINSFGNAEEISANWNGVKGTQILELKYNQPYIYNLPFGIDYHFDLFKKDTTYIKLRHRIGLKVRTGNNQYFTAFYRYEGSRVINRKIFEQYSSLPVWADYKTNTFGIDWSAYRYDYYYNPGKGWKLEFEVSAGNKKMINAPDVDDELFEGLKMVTRQIQVGSNGNLFVPLIKRSILYFSLKGKAKLSNQLFENEAYLIGGLKSLRGFDEKSISATAWVISTAEYRFRFEKDAYFNIFFDYAWYENKLVSSYINDFPFGFGVGIAFPTKAGIITISYAYGKQQNNPIDLKSAKVHIGLVSSF